MDIQQTKSLRKIFLLKLYETTGGDRWNGPTMFQIGRYIGIDDKLTNQIADYLYEKGFIEIHSKDSDISITTSGIDEAESYYETEDVTITPDEISEKLKEINEKLNILSMGQKIVYDDIIEQLAESKSIQKKDFVLILISTFFSKGIDAIKIAKLIDLL